jgi:thiol-disulfide isomerase/thioredoxin
MLNMKKTTLLAVMAMLCLNFWVKAQISPTFAALKVGDKLPESFWQSKVNILFNDGAKQEIVLNAYKGKALLIDFWACWCGSCINHFMLLNQIQASNPSLAIIPVNTKTSRDTDERILELTSGKKYPKIKLDMPTIVSDTTITRFFPHHGIPYYIWISKDGRVRSITMSLLVNEPNIKLLVNAEN